MKLISVNAGLPREVEWNGKTVRTSIFKDPVQGLVRVSQLNISGDRQSDLRVHGGVYKAVYAYPTEHYTYWRSELPNMELPWGAFGENLSVAGLDEHSLHIGDRLSIGSSVLMVTQPRMPCFKLAIRMGRPDMVKRFLDSGRSGFYFSVVREGELKAGDPISIVHRDPDAVPVSTINNLYNNKAPDRDLLKKVSQVSALPESWREHFQLQLENGNE